MIRLQEIQSIYISQNRLVEGKDYVRAEWLKVDGSAYLQTLPILDDTDILNIKYTVHTYSVMFLNTEKCVLGSSPTTQNSPNVALYTKTNYVMYFTKKEGRYADITIDFSRNKMTDNVNHTASFNIESFTSNTIKLKGGTTKGGTIQFKEFIVNNKLTLTPCQLLRSIPATLDANNIARTAGECGMIDSISGKFYGNVASSGSFTVEGLDESGTVEDTRLHQIYTNKLVEGEDYRCYDWLERKSSAMGYMFFVSIPTTPTYVRLYNYKTQGSNGRDMIYCGNSVIQIYPNNSQSEVIYRTSGGSTGTLTTEQDFELKIERNEINDISFASMGAYWENIQICPSTTTGNLTKVGRIYSDTYDYVPCKLLRAIPANRTMDGKSYPAGTMGMIEKVSKKFQPIANAATLTVSYDEWLKDCSIQISFSSYAFGYSTRIDTTKLTSELVNFGFVKLSNTQIVYGDEDDGHVYTVDWGTNKWATLNILYNRGAVATILNGTTVGTSYNTILDQNPHIQLYEIMQIKQIDWSIMEDNIVTTTTLTRYVDETTGQQGLISNQDGTIIYAD